MAGGKDARRENANRIKREATDSSAGDGQCGELENGCRLRDGWTAVRWTELLKRRRSAPVPLQRGALERFAGRRCRRVELDAYRQSGKYTLTSWFVVSRVWFRLRQRSRCRGFAGSSSSGFPFGNSMQNALGIFRRSNMSVVFF